MYHKFMAGEKDQMSELEQFVRKEGLEALQSFLTNMGLLDGSGVGSWHFASLFGSQFEDPRQQAVQRISVRQVFPLPIGADPEDYAITASVAQEFSDDLHFGPPKPWSEEETEEFSDELVNMKKAEDAENGVIEGEIIETSE